MTSGERLSISCSPHAEWAIGERHEQPALQIDHCKRDPVPGFAHKEASARSCRRIVGWTQQSRLLVQKLQNFLPVPDVISGGQHLYAHFKKLVGQRRCDPVSRGRVLDVGHAQVYPSFLEDLGKMAPNGFSAGSSKDVANKQDPQILDRHVPSMGSGPISGLAGMAWKPL